jgi:hypothetical protein
MIVHGTKTFAAALALLAVLGCGKSGTVPTIAVTGTVTHNGQPVEGVSVGFIPESGRPASGLTDAQGRFTLSTFASGDGAVAGSHKVVITEAASEPEPMPGTPEAENYKPRESRVPAKYSSEATTPFSVQVEVGGKNDFTFDMTDG